MTAKRDHAAKRDDQRARHAAKRDDAAKRYDVVGVGNAIVDVIAQADETSSPATSSSGAWMTLIDADRAVHLYDAMGPAIEASGGSAANTRPASLSLGGRAGFIGKVRDDQLGEVFAHDMRAVGVDYDVGRPRPTARRPPAASSSSRPTPSAR